MSRQNRVQPDGTILAHPARGMLMGNRGILHEGGTLGTRRWTHPHWITCRLAFKDRRRALMAPGAYTELFFLDEAVACAAGHRPCAECRRAEYLAFKAHWQAAFGPADAAGIDAALHAARLENRRQRRHVAEAGSLPEASFLLWQDRPHLLHHGALHPYRPQGYGAAIPLPSGPVVVLTPAPMVTLFAAGWRPELHPSLS